MNKPANEQALNECLHQAGYLPDAGLSTTVWLAMQLQRPILVEGDAGVGKTFLAKALAKALHIDLVRLQCYEGLDSGQAVYEWNYGKQLMAIRLQQDHSLQTADLFQTEYLLQRPLLKAITADQPVVLLIDEIDRADEAFEAYLLEVLAENQITIPEIGTLHAKHTPIVVLTSNGTRELSDALRRRCLYHYLDYPTLGREIAIVKHALPQADAHMVEEAIALVQRIRKLDLNKTPGVAESLDWVRALHNIYPHALPEEVDGLLQTLSCLLKTREDQFALDRMVLQQLRESSAQRQGVAVKHAAQALPT
jgi:MoxR-like ATPase